MSAAGHPSTRESSKPRRQAPYGPKPTPTRPIAIRDEFYNGGPSAEPCGNARSDTSPSDPLDRLPTEGRPKKAAVSASSGVASESDAIRKKAANKAYSSVFRAKRKNDRQRMMRYISTFVKVEETVSCAATKARLYAMLKEDCEPADYDDEAGREGYEALCDRLREEQEQEQEQEHEQGDEEDVVV